MNLKDEFLAALHRGDDQDTLLDLVHRHEDRGLSASEAYQLLQQLWLDFGFNKIEEGSSLQDNLEYVLEKIWYECPASDR
jgi:hypothetical protein